MTVTASVHNEAMAGAWHPWRALRERPHLELVWSCLPEGPGGRIIDFGSWREIVLDPRLGRCDRRAVLAHELVHDERNILYIPTTPPALVEKEEALVNREVAHRLVPMTLLVRFVERVVDLGEPVHAAAVMEEFDVPLDVAQRALWLLDQRRST